MYKKDKESDGGKLESVGPGHDKDAIK